MIFSKSASAKTFYLTIICLENVAK